VIAVVDYGVGNLRSVAKALEKVGASVRVTSSASDLADAQAVVLPGVGAFARCMGNLEEAGLREAVCRAATSGKPFLGICVGMQILFDHSDEFGRVEGLGLLPGHVSRFEGLPRELKVPHMGWNEIKLRGASPYFEGIADNERFYFVHSYRVLSDNEQVVAAACDYGGSFVAAAARDNLLATQFHPEKSQSAGLRLLANFVGTAGENS